MAMPSTRMRISRRAGVITCSSRSPTNSNSENHATTPPNTPSANSSALVYDSESQPTP